MEVHISIILFTFTSETVYRRGTNENTEELSKQLLLWK